MKRLEEIKKREEEHKKKERDWSYLEYERYNEKFQKSMANHEFYMS